MPEHVWGNQPDTAAPTRTADADVAEDRCAELKQEVAHLKKQEHLGLLLADEVCRARQKLGGYQGQPIESVADDVLERLHYRELRISELEAQLACREKTVRELEERVLQLDTQRVTARRRLVAAVNVLRPFAAALAVGRPGMKQVYERLSARDWHQAARLVKASEQWREMSSRPEPSWELVSTETFPMLPDPPEGE